MFDHVGIIEATHTDGSLDLESVAIEIGAQNVESTNDEEDDSSATKTAARFFTDIADLDGANKSLQAAGWNVSKCELGYSPKNLVTLNEEQEKEVIQFLQDIDDFDDVHRVYVAIK
jgi:transcriptional/translational regulatory protein YebC/TACO1